MLWGIALDTFCLQTSETTPQNNPDPPQADSVTQQWRRRPAGGAAARPALSAAGGVPRSCEGGPRARFNWALFIPKARQAWVTVLKSLSVYRTHLCRGRGGRRERRRGRRSRPHLRAGGDGPAAWPGWSTSGTRRRWGAIWRTCTSSTATSASRRRIPKVSGSPASSSPAPRPGRGSDGALQAASAWPTTWTPSRRTSRRPRGCCGTTASCTGTARAATGSGPTRLSAKVRPALRRGPFPLPNSSASSHPSSPGSLRPLSYFIPTPTRPAPFVALIKAGTDGKP